MSGLVLAAQVGFDRLDVESRAPAAGDGLKVELRPAGFDETVVVIGADTARRTLRPESTDLVGSVDIMTSDQLERAEAVSRG
ncbi:MAG: hypothetical protein FJW27_16270 [Acidimicrobiia bacterium]|nr:hypothetical protein [Acidimicrobiia bacterium]